MMRESSTGTESRIFSKTAAPNKIRGSARRGVARCRAPPCFCKGNRDVQCRLEIRQSVVIHMGEEPLAAAQFTGRVDLDDTPDHVGCDRDIGGDALRCCLRGIALDRDGGFPFGRQGDPIMGKVGAIGEKAQHGGFADKWGAVIERKRAVVSPQARHRVQVATVCERSMVACQQLEHPRL